MTETKNGCGNCMFTARMKERNKSYYRKTTRRGRNKSYDRNTGWFIRGPCRIFYLLFSILFTRMHTDTTYTETTYTHADKETPSHKKNGNTCTLKPRRAQNCTSCARPCKHTRGDKHNNTYAHTSQHRHKCIKLHFNICNTILAGGDWRGATINAASEMSVLSVGRRFAVACQRMLYFCVTFL